MKKEPKFTLTREKVCHFSTREAFSTFPEPKMFYLHRVGGWGAAQDDSSNLWDYVGECGD